MADSTLRDWALAYAARGLVVLPLLERGKEARERGRYCDCTGDVDVPLIGSGDPAWVEDVWTRRPQANLGVVCGGRSGLLVMDVDVKRHGAGDLQVWEYEQARAGRVLPATVSYHTATGGFHRWYRLPRVDGRYIHVRRNDYWLRGVEIKACGGYVAAPPTVRALPVERDEGGFIVTDEELRPYVWDDTGVFGIAEAPAWLLEDVAARHQGYGTRPGSNGSGGAVGGGQLPPTKDFLEAGLGWFTGSRNTDAFRLSCRLWLQHGVDNDVAVLADVERAWQATPDKSGCDWGEIRAAVLSAGARMRRKKLEEDEGVRAMVAALERGAPWS